MSIAVGLQALGAGFQGGDAGAVVKRYRDQLESMERKQRVGSLLERMDISGPQRAILETMPAEQVPGMLWQLQQQQAAQRAAGGAAAAKAAEQQRQEQAYMEALKGYAQPSQPSPYSTGVPVNEMPMSNFRPSFPPGMSSAPQGEVAASMFRNGDPRMMSSGLTPPPPGSSQPPAPSAGAAMPPGGLSFGQVAPAPETPTSPYEVAQARLRQLTQDPAQFLPDDSPQKRAWQAYFDKYSRDVEMFAPEKQPTTDDITEYQFAVKNDGYTGTLQQFMAKNRTPLVENNIGGDGNNFGSKYWEGRYEKLNDAAFAAGDMLGMYDVAEAALSSGVRTGAGAETELAFRRIGAALGMDTDPEKIAGGELIRAVQNRMALMMRNPDGGMGMPGAMSDADREFLKQAQVGLTPTPEGNKKLLKAFRAIEQRKIDLAELADQYIAENGTLDRGFGDVVRQYANENPMFDEEFFGTSAPVTSDIPTYNPETGEWE